MKTKQELINDLVDLMNGPAMLADTVKEMAQMQVNNCDPEDRADAQKFWDTFVRRFTSPENTQRLIVGVKEVYERHLDHNELRALCVLYTEYPGLVSKLSTIAIECGEIGEKIGIEIVSD